MAKNYFIAEHHDASEIDNDSESEYWNSICEFHKVASPDDPYPCLSKDIGCCPMNSVLRKRGDLEEKMKEKGYSHAVWAVYKDAQINAVPMCSLVWLTESPSEEVLHEIFEDRLIRYSVAKFNCADDCECHSAVKKIPQ